MCVLYGTKRVAISCGHIVYKREGNHNCWVNLNKLLVPVKQKRKVVEELPTMYEVRLFAVAMIAEVHLYRYNWCTGASSALVMTNGKFLRFGFCTDIMHTRKYIQHWKQDICVACEICWCVFDNKQTHNIYVLCTLHASSVIANCIKQEIVVTDMYRSTS